MDATAILAVRYRAQAPEAPKHARLRAAFMDAVRSGEIPVGTKIAGERDLSEALGVSLGTTQKALGRLVGEGFRIRRQGHGTFVGSDRKPVSGSWHYRFLDADRRSEMPVFATLLEREIVGADGPWAEALGPDPVGYVMLRRRLDIGRRFACSSRLVLPAERFGRLMRVAERRLTDVNLKALLESDYAAPTLGTSGVAHVVPIEASDARVIGISPGTIGLRVDIVGHSFARAPITFQRMVVPPTTHGLMLNFASPGSDGNAA